MVLVSDLSIFLGDLGTQFGRKRLNVIASSLKTRSGLRNRRHLGSTPRGRLKFGGMLACVPLRAGPELLGTVA